MNTHGAQWPVRAEAPTQLNEKKNEKNVAYVRREHPETICAA